MEFQGYSSTISEQDNWNAAPSYCPVNVLRKYTPLDYVFSALLSAGILLLFVLQQPEKLVHWMLVPLWLCGSVVLADALRWLKGNYALYDPKGVVGAAGINFFLTAPLLIIFYDRPGVETYVVSDWRPLLGLMAVFNFFGLILYKIFEKIAFRRPSKVQWTYWTLNPGRASFYIPLFIVGSFLALCIYIIRGGGLAGVILQERQGELSAEGLAGFGAVMVLRDAFPMSVLIGLTAVRIIRGAGKSSWWFFLGFGLLVLFFITSGLRGSRAAIMYGLICAGAAIHYFWHRISIRMILISLIPLLIFFYFYGFYKSAGITGIRELIRGQTTLESLQEQTGRTISGYLVGDLSRAHVQAVELDILLNKPWSYRYRYGKTYPLALASMIPRQIWRTKPLDMGRIVAGTEMLYGPGSYGEYAKIGGGGSRSTQLYGLAGEAMLNFGVYGILPAFAVWGYIVGRIRKRLYSFRQGDLRLIMTGFWMIFSFVMLLADADQLVWFTISLYVVPAILVYLISDKNILIPADGSLYGI
ncbi:MAG TPA: hypothetical protein PKY88_10000 [Anaerohalosphaeraceae bacterium]|nr:hypothetical protein [Anaerohalosphaeraceae bacterium]